MSKFKPGRGLDIGTSYIIVGRAPAEGEGITYTEMRDCFFRLEPKSKIARQIIEKGLNGQKYFKDGNDFVVVGQDAIERAIERNASTFRPMVRGVLSPKERRARSILRFILGHVLGKPVGEEEKIIYSVPSQPIDRKQSEYDVAFHQDALRNDLDAMGFKGTAIPEAEAVCYSELGSDGYTGIGMSWGAGMVNCCLMSAGEGILHWATTRSGDWIDQRAALASDAPETVVQVEKENGGFSVGTEVDGDPILSAIAIYYQRLIDYTAKAMVSQLVKTDRPFKDPVPVVLAGGTARAEGFCKAFAAALKEHAGEDLPFEIKEVRLAKDPLRAISRGCLLAAELA
jgi:hypothetical protein